MNHNQWDYNHSHITNLVLELRRTWMIWFEQVINQVVIINKSKGINERKKCVNSSWELIKFKWALNWLNIEIILYRQTYIGLHSDQH